MSNDKMTVEMCQDHCYDHGHSYAGVQARSECWCGSSLPDPSLIRPDSECNTPCAGNASQMCGGGWRNNVYNAQPIVNTNNPTTTEEANPTTTEESNPNTTEEGRHIQLCNH